MPLPVLTLTLMLARVLMRVLMRVPMQMRTALALPSQVRRNGAVQCKSLVKGSLRGRRWS